MKAEIYRNAEQPKLFENKVLEKLTYSSPAGITIMYLILASALVAYYAIAINPASTAFFLIGWFLIGLFSWSLGEYILHRFLYHKIKDASYDTGLQYLFHGIHHKYPNDTKRIVLPVLPSLIIASSLFGLFYLLFWIITGSGSLAFLFGAGFIIGYLIYMLIHYMVHAVPSPKKYNFWWRHHNIHHFQQHDRAFGVSTPIWDIIFRTMPQKGRKTITEKAA
jgi:sterol desaturase/sphingolipid hydroxylase (fatty acid hydroxylase superfamily)